MTRIEKQKSFLQEILSEEALKKVRLASWQNRVLVDDPETFQKIASKTNIKVISVNKENISFSHDLIGLTNLTNTWSYELTKDREVFLEKYGALYHHK